jgi:hypothetical protein
VKAAGARCLWTWLRPALLVCGLGLVGYFVAATGPAAVLAALVRAGPYFFVIALLEASALLTDTAAFGLLLGPKAKEVSARGWLRSSAASYSCLVLLPAGRAASEVARASLVASAVGPRRAATAALRLQATALVADGLISGALALVVLRLLGNPRHLSALLAGNFVLATLVGLGLLTLSRSASAAELLVRRFPRIAGGVGLGPIGGAPDGAPTRALAASLLSLFGRILQWLEYGVAVRAVGGQLALGSAGVAYGVHMVGATVGMAIPNQVGVADGAYLLYADSLGFGSAPALALSVMLSVRAAQLLFALVCLGVPALVPEARKVAPA